LIVKAGLKLKEFLIKSQSSILPVSFLGHRQR
jgi:hypothetical protein